MFPIPKDEVSPFIKKNIDTYRTFKSEEEKSKYIDLLDSEMKMINKMNLSDAAKNVYNKKYAFPDSKLAQRCLDYKALEQHAREWNK